MGMIDVNLKITNPHNPQKTYEGDFLVDTGAKYTVLPESVWKNLGLKPERNQKFSLADGSVVERPISSAYIKYGRVEAPGPVILGKKNDSPLLGVVNLETMGLTISPFTRQIYPDKLMTLLISALDKDSPTLELNDPRLEAGKLSHHSFDGTLGRNKSVAHLFLLVILVSEAYPESLIKSN